MRMAAEPTAKIRLAMQKAMQADAAVFRTQNTLDEGVTKIRDIYKSLDECWYQGPQHDLELVCLH
jgi:succinate dehydrogenase/fumarate reductase flavoprotein subunit